MTARIWALLGRRAGDNRQLAALAEATGWSWEAKPLAFDDVAKQKAPSRRGGLGALDDETRRRLTPPWPDLVLAAGRLSAPVALHVKAASGGRTRIVHIGRPWAPLGWFDLVITTPQYGLPARPNVLENRLPLTAARPAEAVEPDPDLMGLPRPRLVALVGGGSPPRVLDAAAARAFVAEALARVGRDGGALLVATSPRTSPEAAAALREALAGAAAPVRLSIFGEVPNAYRAFLAAADAFLVTDDSASMIAEAAIAGAPVAVFPLPHRPSAKKRRQGLLRRATAGTAATRALFERLVDWGYVISVRDLDRFVEGLASAGLLEGGTSARAHAARELEDSARRVRLLVGGADGR